MSQSAKSNSTVPYVFVPDVAVERWYGWARLLPILALAYLAGGWQLLLMLAVGLPLGWLYWVWSHNHRFVLTDTHLTIYHPFGNPTPLHRVSFDQLASVSIRLGRGWDQRQWLDLYTIHKVHTRWRCDALHEQDPPEPDDHHHDHPEHELFALLEEEDFYEGSLQHFASLLRQRGIPDVQLSRF